jgi:hypothetical protein
MVLCGFVCFFFGTIHPSPVFFVVTTPPFVLFHQLSPFPISDHEVTPLLAMPTIPLSPSLIVPQGFAISDGGASHAGQGWHGDARTISPCDEAARLDGSLAVYNISDSHQPSTQIALSEFPDGFRPWRLALGGQCPSRFPDVRSPFIQTAALLAPGQGVITSPTVVHRGPHLHG